MHRKIVVDLSIRLLHDLVRLIGTACEQLVAARCFSLVNKYFHVIVFGHILALSHTFFKAAEWSNMASTAHWYLFMRLNDPPCCYSLTQPIRFLLNITALWCCKSVSQWSDMLQQSPSLKQPLHAFLHLPSHLSKHSEHLISCIQEHPAKINIHPQQMKRRQNSSQPKMQLFTATASTNCVRFKETACMKPVKNLWWIGLNNRAFMSPRR